jgi:hypothetical protein
MAPFGYSSVAAIRLSFQLLLRKNEKEDSTITVPFFFTPIRGGSQAGVRPSVLVEQKK